jgi:hypothetical protein
MLFYCAMLSSRVADPHSFHPDPDPLTQLNPDPIRIQIRNPVKKTKYLDLFFFGKKWGPNNPNQFAYQNDYCRTIFYQIPKNW